MTLLSHAENELDAIGMTADSPDKMNVAMREHLIHMVSEFAKEGHSGFSASYAVGILEKLFSYKPLCPLTGADSEWLAIAESQTNGNNGTLYQNMRASHVFKDDDGAYDIDGKIFYDIVTDGEGEPHKSYFTGLGSRVPVTFPYTPVSEYLERPEE